MYDDGVTPALTDDATNLDDARIDEVRAMDAIPNAMAETSTVMLPFAIKARTKGMSSAVFTAEVNGTIKATESYALGSYERRIDVARRWSEHPALRNGKAISESTIALELERIEGECIAALKDAERDADLDRCRNAGDDDGEEKKKDDSQATKLVKLALSTRLVLWHDQDKNPWATVPVDEHWENHALTTKAFRLWCAALYYNTTGKTPGSQAVQDALAALGGLAVHKGSQHKVHVRLAQHDGAMYIDLGDEAWNVVKITAQDWSVTSDCPVKFRRARAMLPLPTPINGGSLGDLRRLINVASESDFVLIVSWLVAALHPKGPYPVLAVYGEHGAAKSFVSWVLRAMIDPNSADLRAQPRDERDLVIAAKNGWVIALDNLSGIPTWLSDSLCRLSTGGGFSTRELFTNDDESIFASTRPIILNGIEELATRPDLLDRCIQVTLPSIPEERKKRKEVLEQEFKDAHSRLLGTLLAAVSTAMRNVGTVKLDRLPRMADAAQWIVAAEPALPWNSGAFMDAYGGNRAAANELAIEASPVGMHVRAFVELQSAWSGSATDLLKALTDRLPRKGDRPELPDGWPKRGNKLSGYLKRLAPNLRAAGINIRWEREESKTRTRTIHLERVSVSSSASSASSETPLPQPKTGITSDDGRTVRTIPGRSSDGESCPESAAPDDSDATDDQIHVHSKVVAVNIAPGADGIDVPEGWSAEAWAAACDGSAGPAVGESLDLSALTKAERETWNERAGAIEAGGVPRPEAERRAMESIHRDRC